MEPGHEDREYSIYPVRKESTDEASMEPGHEDREYVWACAKTLVVFEPQWSPVMKTGNTSPMVRCSRRVSGCLNGARS